MDFDKVVESIYSIIYSIYFKTKDFGQQSYIFLKTIYTYCYFKSHVLCFCAQLLENMTNCLAEIDCLTFQFVKSIHTKIVIEFFT